MDGALKTDHPSRQFGEARTFRERQIERFSRVWPFAIAILKTRREKEGRADGKMTSVDVHDLVTALKNLLESVKTIEEGGTREEIDEALETFLRTMEPLMNKGNRFA